MFTERFNRLRKKTLDNVFQKKVLVTNWKKIVKDQLRNLDIKDIYDYYDFNYDIEDRSQAIRNEILSGTYKVSSPLIYRIEKKLGICRHIIVPQPIDALVLQTITESISSKILERQPSRNSFYSRDKHNTKFPHDLDDYGLNWRELWKELQKKIYQFNEDKSLLISTDLVNYYDTIDIKELHKLFIGFANANETLVDLLFRIIEEISWKPDYMPYSNRGLPTSNLEGVRLLAHSFLFEMDEILKQKTNDNFTRWMDDIIIGVDSKKEAVEILSEISDLLKSRGLGLNLSKTAIYSSDDGFYHFLMDDNKYLDRFNQILDRNGNADLAYLEKKFKNHLKDTKPKYWDKVAKRFITAFGKAKSLRLLKFVKDLYIDFPGLRVNLVIYLINLGYTKKTSAIVKDILQEISLFDDISLYQVCSLLTTWNIPDNEESKGYLNEVGDIIDGISFKRKTNFDFYCSLWFRAKYNHPDKLLKFIMKWEGIWQRDSFLRRQVTCLMSRLLAFNPSKVHAILDSQISSGIPNAVSVALSIREFGNLDTMNRKLDSYVFYKSKSATYPLQKFLVLCSILNSEKIRENMKVREKVLLTIKDRYYLKWLDQQYNIS